MELSSFEARVAVFSTVLSSGHKSWVVSGWRVAEMVQTFPGEAVPVSRGQSCCQGHSCEPFGSQHLQYLGPECPGLVKRIWVGH